MNKMKRNLVFKILNSNITSYEFDLIIFLTTIQEEDGTVASIYYKNIKDNRNMEDPAEWNEDDIELLQEIERRFKEKNSTVMCRELKGIGTGIVLRPCRGCVEDAAEILEEILEERS